MGAAPVRLGTFGPVTSAWRDAGANPLGGIIAAPPGHQQMKVSPGRLRVAYGSALPISWQGWLSMALFIAAMAAIAALLHGLPRTLGAALLIVGFIALYLAKSDGEWRWPWGERR